MKNFHKEALSIMVGALAIVFSAFTTLENETSNLQSSYYWFPTNAAGNALLDATGIPLSQEASANRPCNGEGSYCARGFTAAETTISGGKRVPNIPIVDGAEARQN